MEDWIPAKHRTQPNLTTTNVNQFFRLCQIDCISRNKLSLDQLYKQNKLHTKRNSFLTL